MTAVEHVDGPGERLVAVITCIERCWHESASPLLPGGQPILWEPDPAPDPEAVLVALRAHGPGELVEPFEAWLRLRKDLEAATAALGAPRDREGDSDDRPPVAGPTVQQVRRYRQAVQHLAADIRRRVASHIDLVAAHQVSAD